jgi:hypothetical protein
MRRPQGMRRWKMWGERRRGGCRTGGLRDYGAGGLFKWRIGGLRGGGGQGAGGVG